MSLVSFHKTAKGIPLGCPSASFGHDRPIAFCHLQGDFKVMKSRLALVMSVAFLATAHMPAAQADHFYPVHPFHFAFNDCGWGTSGHCLDRDRDFLVDRLYRVTCAEARDILDDRGFSNIKTLSCGGAAYKFKARWKGKNYILRVSRSTGDLLSMKRVRNG